MFRSTLGQCGTILFDSPEGDRSPVRRAGRALILVFLYVAGALHWVIFFHAGHMSFRAYDWSEKHHFYMALQEGLRSLRFPFYISPSWYGHDRLLGLLQLPLSPHIALLWFLDIGAFVFWNALFFYTLFYVGCLLLKWRYNLSIATFTVVFLLLGFNGHLTSHLSAGHVEWFAYLLMPFFLLGVLEIRRDAFSWRTVLGLSITLFAMLLQGGMHIYDACHLFLLLIVLTNWSKLTVKRFAQVCGLGIGLGLCRFLPALASMASLKLRFWPGFWTPSEIVESLVVLHDAPYNWHHGTKTMVDIYHVWDNAAYSWEYDMFIGLTGFLFLVFAGIGLRFWRNAPSPMPRFKNLDWALLGVAFLAMGANYYFVNASPVPFLNTVERAPSRFFAIPLAALIVIAAIRYQRLLDAGVWRRQLRVAAVLGLPHMAFLLHLHSTVWKIPVQEVRHSAWSQVNPATLVAGNDPAYEWAVRVSAVLSLCVFALWVVLALRARKERTTS